MLLLIIAISTTITNFRVYRDVLVERVLCCLLLYLNLLAAVLLIVSCVALKSLAPSSLNQCRHYYRDSYRQRRIYQLPI